MKRDLIECALFPLFGLRQPENPALGVTRCALPADRFLTANLDEPIHELHSGVKPIYNATLADPTPESQFGVWKTAVFLLCKAGRNHLAAQHIYDNRADNPSRCAVHRHIPVARTTQGGAALSFEERRTDAGTENTVSAWVALLGAGLLEIAWALGLKYSDGLTRFWPTVATLVAIALSFGLMALALRSLPFGTAYAVWTGIGAAGSIIVGIILYSEPADPVRIFCLTLIVAGMVGLKLNSPI